MPETITITDDRTGKSVTVPIDRGTFPSSALRELDPSLFQDRLVRPLALDTAFSFFASPCEDAPVSTFTARRQAPAAEDHTSSEPASDEESTLGLLRRLAAERLHEVLHQGRTRPDNPRGGVRAGGGGREVGDAGPQWRPASASAVRQRR